MKPIGRCGVLRVSMGACPAAEEPGAATPSLDLRGSAAVMLQMSPERVFVTTDALREAQRDPEKHRGLVIRVAGYSAYFTALEKELQDDIINRTEQMSL